MATISDVFGELPRLKFNQLDSTVLSPEQIWADYDELTDSLVFYFTGQPVEAISVHLEEDLYAMVASASRDVVGIHIEAFERKFLEKHPLLQTSWPHVKESLASDPESEPNSLMQLFSFGMAFVVGSNGQSRLKAA